MNTKSTAIAAAALALMIISAPAQVMAQAAPGGANGGSAAAGGGVGSGEGGTYGFGSAYHNIVSGEYSCDYLRKRAQWSDAYYWWQKYSRCIAK